MPSDFVLIVALEWQEIPNASVLVREGGMEENYMRSLIDSNDFPPIRQWAENVGLLPENTTRVVTAARMFDIGSPVPGEINIRLWLIISE